MRTLALIALLLPTCALGEPPHGWYAFVEVGSPRTTASMSRQADDADLAASGFNVVGSSESRGETALALGGGYQISKHFSVEASYTDLGQLHYYQGTFTAAPNSGSQVKEWRGAAIGLAALGAVPLRGGFSLLGKISALRFDGDYRTETLILAPVPPGSPPGTPQPVFSRTAVSLSGHATVPGFGFGAAYAASPKIQVRVMFERWRSKAGMFGAGNDLDHIHLFSLGVLYHL